MKRLKYFAIYMVGFALGILATFTLILTWPVRRPPMPTKHARRYRDDPKRHLSREVQQGIRELGERDGVRYEFLCVTGHEE